MVLGGTGDSAECVNSRLWTCEIAATKMQRGRPTFRAARKGTDEGCELLGQETQHWVWGSVLGRSSAAWAFRAW